jgi:uroporphyrinogen-III decarboxylase
MNGRERGTKETMSSRERLRAAFEGKPTDRVPWSPCVDGYFLSSLREREEIGETELHRAIGADALLRHVMVFTSTQPMLGLLNRPADNPRIDLRVQPTSTGCYRVSYETAVGTLTEEVLFNAQSMNIPWFVKRKLRTVEDVKIYMHVLETTRSEPHFGPFTRKVRDLGDHGLVTTTGPASPMEHLINLEMGVEALTYALNDDPSTMEECFELMHESNLEAYRIIAESPAEVVISYENLSTTLTSPKNYRRFDRLHCNDYAAICHDASKTYLTHMCGRLTGFAEDFAEAWQDGFVDVAPAPTGDVRFGEAKRGWAKDRVLVGGIDATAFTSLTPDEITGYVWRLLDEIGEEAGEIRKFVLGSGDAVPKDTPLPVLHAVSEAVRAYSARRF